VANPVTTAWPIHSRCERDAEVQSVNIAAMNLLVLLVILAPAFSAVAQGQISPPPMAKRAIALSTTEARGTQVALSDRGTNFTLFLPDGWTNVLSGQTEIYVHFHTVPWFAIQEHIRRGAKEPLLVFALGEGSRTYRLAFEDTNRFARVLAMTEAALQNRSGSTNVRVGTLSMSSFSAGYGAVREIVKSPGYFKAIRRLALLDSFYGGLEPQQNGATNRVPLAEHVDVWIPFARAATRGEKTFVITHSQVVTTDYASTFECARALLQRLSIKVEPVARDLSAAANDADFPLLARADMKGLHVWSYGGTDAQAHLTHARHMAEVWQTLDDAAGTTLSR
jgi:hypothetical protein